MELNYRLKKTNIKGYNSAYSFGCGWNFHKNISSVIGLDKKEQPTLINHKSFGTHSAYDFSNLRNEFRKMIIVTKFQGEEEIIQLNDNLRLEKKVLIEPCRNKTLSVGFNYKDRTLGVDTEFKESHQSTTKLKIGNKLIGNLFDSIGEYVKNRFNPREIHSGLDKILRYKKDIKNVEKSLLDFGPIVLFKINELASANLGYEMGICPECNLAYCSDHLIVAGRGDEDGTWENLLCKPKRHTIIYSMNEEWYDLEL